MIGGGTLYSRASSSPVNRREARSSASGRYRNGFPFQPLVEHKSFRGFARPREGLPKMVGEPSELRVV